MNKCCAQRADGKNYIQNNSAIYLKNVEISKNEERFSILQLGASMINLGYIFYFKIGSA